MIELNQILCPTSLSPESNEALRYASALARAYDANLEVVHCGEPGWTKADGDDELFPSEQRSAIKTLLETHGGEADGSPLVWEAIVIPEPCDAGEEIVREAAENGVNLIVMRSRRRPRAAALLGSTAERVYRTAPCPVLVTHPEEREWVSPATGKIDLRRILVAHDFSSDSTLAVGHALSLAHKFRAELHLIHILGLRETDGPEVAFVPGSTEAIYNGAMNRLVQSVPNGVGNQIKLLPAIRWGKTYQEILTYAKEREIDLICMGVKGRNFGLNSLFGSNVDRVLRQSPCPVLVVRPLRPKIDG